MTFFSIGFLIFLGGGIGMTVSIWRQNILIFLITTEVMFLGIIVTFIVLSAYGYMNTHFIALIILTLAALETAIGLCILVQAKAFVNSLSFGSFHVLNG